MQPDQYWIASIASNLVSVLLLLICINRPRLARLLFSLLFLWAAFTNWRTAHHHPSIYQEYADMAMVGMYKNFITGFFASNTVIIVSFIAASQLLIGFSVLLKGIVFKIGCIGGIIFLFAILPLGLGSAFPCTLIMSAGLFILLRKKDTSFIWENKNQREMSC